MMTQKQTPSLFKIFLVALIISLMCVQFFSPIFSAIFPSRNSLDDSVYHIVGAGMMDGVLPYRDLFDHKGPLTYLFFGIGSFLTPHSTAGVGFLSAFLLATLLLFAYRTSQLYLPVSTSILLSLCLLLFIADWSPDPVTIGLFCYIVTLYYFLRYWRDPSQKTPWVALGACVSCLLLLKFNLTAFWIPILSAMYLHLWKHHGFTRCLAAIGKTTLGVVLPTLPFLVYLAIHEQGLRSMWESYVMFSTQYTTQSDPVWQTKFISLWGGFFPSSIFHPTTPAGEHVKIALGFLTIGTGFFALCWRKYRNMLFPTGAMYGIPALVLGFIFLFIVNFSGPFNWPGYYRCFVPYYALSILALGTAVHTFASKRSGIIILSSIAFLSLGAHTYQAYKSVSNNLRSPEPQLDTFVKAHPDASLILYDTGISHYLHSNTHPAVRKFYNPPVSGFGRDEDIVRVLSERKCEYFISSMRSIPRLAPGIRKELEQHYQLLPADKTEVPDFRIYRRRDKEECFFVVPSPCPEP